MNRLGPVHSPAAVTIHCRKNKQQKARQHQKQQETTQKPSKQNKTHQKQATWKVIGGPVQRLMMRVR